MPFGLCNAPATFERLMERVLGGLTWQICLVYLDDIIVFSKSFDKHLKSLEQVFCRIKEANLKLSPDKCFLFQKRVTFLGHIISGNGVETDPKKIEAVKNWPVPRNIKEVRSFLGLCSYYRKFVYQFATIAKPLHKLTETSKEFSWTEQCNKAFNQLKQSLMQAPILTFPTTVGQFILDTDASKYGIGAVLSQMQDGKEKVISYYSKCMSKAETNYCVTRKELLAVIKAVQQFHHYLYGSHFLIRSDHGALRWLANFKSPEGQIARWLEILSTYDYEIQHRAGRVHSNADALSRRPCQADCSYCKRAESRYHGALCGTDGPRWVCDSVSPSPLTLPHEEGYIMDGNFSVVPKPHGVCSFPLETMDDHCSQMATDHDEHRKVISCVSDYVVDGEETPPIGGKFREYKYCCFADITVNMDVIRKEQDSDPIISVLKNHVPVDQLPSWSDIAAQPIGFKYFWNRFQSLKVERDILFYVQESIDGKSKTDLIMLPKSLVEPVLTDLHNSPTSGHLGLTKTYERVKSRFLWYGMKSDVERWVKMCDACESVRAPNRKPRAKMKQNCVGLPLERVGIDIMGPITTSESENKYVLVIVDYFTKWTMALPIKNQEAETIAQAFVTHFISNFGVPKLIHSDQGSNFESKVFREMCVILGAEKRRTTAFRPQSDGLVERANRTLQNMLAKFVSSHQKDWDRFLPLLTFAYNTAVHHSTGFAPCQLMMGRNLNLPLDVVLGKPKQDRESYSQYGRKLENIINHIHDIARRNLKFSSDAQKRVYDHKANQRLYQEGDLVWLYHNKRSVGLSTKLACKWTGPHKIVKRLNDVIYRVQKSSKSLPKVVHHDRLKLYCGRGQFK